MASTSTRAGRRRLAQRYDEDSPNSAARPRRRKRTWLLMAVVLGLPALVFVAPIVIAKTPLLGSVVALCAKEVKGDLTVGSATLNWLQPIEFYDIELRDAQNKSVARIE